MNNQKENNTLTENSSGQNTVSNTENTADTSTVYSGDSTLQTKAHFDKDKKTNHTREDNKYTSSDIDDSESDNEAATGTNRAGTAERKKYGDPELNKGLEAQAKDEEL